MTAIGRIFFLIILIYPLMRLLFETWVQNHGEMLIFFFTNHGFEPATLRVEYQNSNHSTTECIREGIESKWNELEMYWKCTRNILDVLEMYLKCTGKGTGRVLEGYWKGTGRKRTVLRNNT